MSPRVVSRRAFVRGTDFLVLFALYQVLQWSCVPAKWGSTHCRPSCTARSHATYSGPGVSVRLWTCYTRSRRYLVKRLQLLALALRYWFAVCGPILVQVSPSQVSALRLRITATNSADCGTSKQFACLDVHTQTDMPQIGQLTYSTFGGAKCPPLKPACPPCPDHPV